MIIPILLVLASTAAGTDDEFYTSQPFKGKWMVTDAFFVPDTAAGLHATNFTTVTVSTNDGAGGSYAEIGSFTTTTVANVVGTSREISISGTGKAVDQGGTFKVAKVDSGSGAVLHGSIHLVLEKVG